MHFYQYLVLQKNIIQNDQFLMDFRKIFRKKIFLENRRKLTPQKYIHLSDISRGRFVYSFDKPKVFGLLGIFFFPKHGIFATCQHFQTTWRKTTQRNHKLIILMSFIRFFMKYQLQGPRKPMFYLIEMYICFPNKDLVWIACEIFRNFSTNPTTEPDFVKFLVISR